MKTRRKLHYEIMSIKIIIHSIINPEKNNLQYFSVIRCFYCISKIGEKSHHSIFGNDEKSVKKKEITVKFCKITGFLKSDPKNYKNVYVYSNYQ